MQSYLRVGFVGLQVRTVIALPVILCVIISASLAILFGYR